MAARNGVLLTAADIEAWRHEREELEKEIRERQEKLLAIKRKLDAAEIFAAELSEQPSSDTATPAAIETTADDDDEADSAADKLVADMRETGAALKTKQIRVRLIELGFGERLKQKPNYVYGLVYRLTKRGRLVRSRGKYRAAPLASSKEETGAVAAPVHH